MLSKEELLLLKASLTCAARASETHLPGAHLTAVEVSFGQISQAANESHVAVQTFRTCHSAVSSKLVCLVDDFLVNFEESFDVIRSEGNGDEDEILLALLDKVFDGIAGLGTKPCRWSDLRLPAETVRVAVTKTLLDSPHGGGDLRWIRVATVDNRHGERVSRVKKDNAVTELLGVFLQGGFDVLSERLNQALVRGPAINHTPLY